MGTSDGTLSLFEELRLLLVGCRPSIMRLARAADWGGALEGNGIRVPVLRRGLLGRQLGERIPEQKHLRL